MPPQRRKRFLERRAFDHSTVKRVFVHESHESSQMACALGVFLNFGFTDSPLSTFLPYNSPFVKIREIRGPISSYRTSRSNSSPLAAPKFISSPSLSFVAFR